MARKNELIQQLRMQVADFEAHANEDAHRIEDLQRKYALVVKEREAAWDEIHQVREESEKLAKAAAEQHAAHLDDLREVRAQLDAAYSDLADVRDIIAALFVAETNGS